MSNSTNIWVKFTKRGIHKYPAAATEPRLNDVSYLGQPHHHFFEFKVTISVGHDDREIEFHQFLNYLEALYDNKVLELSYQSCEMIARQLISQIRTDYGARFIEVDVSEDGYCGATVSENYTNTGCL